MRRLHSLALGHISTSQDLSTVAREVVEMFCEPHSFSAADRLKRVSERAASPAAAPSISPYC